MPDRPARVPLPINWPLWVVPNPDGRLLYPSLEASIHNSIRIILSTKPGEQLMRPEFGAGLESFLHQPNTVTTRRDIQVSITRALERWENRILLDRVEVAEVPDRPTHLRVEIVYRLRRTGVPQRMGLTMKLE